MNIQYFGHNCFIVGKNNTAILIDPWFSEKGAFFGSWMQYPVNHDLKNTAISKLGTFENKYIFITHEHLDHFDLEFLALIDYDFNMIIPDYDGKYLLKTLSKYNPEQLKDSCKKKLSNDLFCKLLISDIGVNHDAAIIVSDGKEGFLNQNDCKIFDRLSSIEENIDYYSVQFSGANAFPSTYHYSDKVKVEISAERSSSKLKNVSNGIKDLQPRLFIPAAGPAVFPHLDFELSKGVGNIFIHQPELKDYLDRKNKNTKVNYLRPGDILDMKNINESPIPPPTDQEMELYKSSMQDVWSQLSENLNVEDLKSSVQSRLNEIKGYALKDLPLIQFVWGEDENSGITIDLNNKILSDGVDKNLKKYFRVSAEEKYFALMSNTKYRWQDISLSMRANIKRRPDIFNSLINVFIFSDIENIKDAFYTSLNIPKDRCIVTGDNGCKYEIDRYCPHQGADLSDSIADQYGHITCPRHGWKFDVHNNGVSARTDTTINAIMIDE